ncbi:MAG: ATP synthase F0 subunit B, partial [Actinomycetota bacterium]|nr:ATP synthase F0 subunit B [Actinomycetota bacterium]
MNLLVTALFAVEDPTQTHHWLLPETAEIIYGGLASVIVFLGLYKFAGPMVKKSMKDRTEKIQKELDGAAAARSKSETDAAGIRQALGDIEAERRKILAEADAQATAILADGRARLVKEVAELEAKAVADLAAARGRSGEELRGEIARLS